MTTFRYLQILILVLSKSFIFLPDLFTLIYGEEGFWFGIYKALGSCCQSLWCARDVCSGVALTLQAISHSALAKHRF